MGLKVIQSTIKWICIIKYFIRYTKSKENEEVWILFLKIEKESSITIDMKDNSGSNITAPYPT